MAANNPTPLLIVSDAVTSSTGLARIALYIAKQTHEKLSDIFRVGTYGYGAPGSRHLGFQQYAMSQPPEVSEFVLPELQSVWDDFAGNERGVILTIWDLSRLMWLGLPDKAPQLVAYPDFRQWLIRKPFWKWAYLPIDATGPNDRLTFPLRKTLSGFDRVLAYSKWAEGVVNRSREIDLDLDNLPHGIDTDVFFESNRKLCRGQFFAKTGGTSIYGLQKSIAADEVLIGIVATNQHRKDFSLGIQTVEILKKKGHKVRLWIHTDSLERYWSIPSRLIDAGIDKDTIVTLGQLPDENLAIAYSACDLTLGIGLGEGFGFPVFESLACGTPCIHGNYGGAPEHGGLHPINTNVYREEGLYSCLRPVYDPHNWAVAAEAIINTKTRAALPAHLDWKNLWPRWEEWLKKGVNV